MRVGVSLLHLSLLDPFVWCQEMPGALPGALTGQLWQHMHKNTQSGASHRLNNVLHGSRSRPNGACRLTPFSFAQINAIQTAHEKVSHKALWIMFQRATWLRVTQTELLNQVPLQAWPQHHLGLPCFHYNT